METAKGYGKSGLKMTDSSYLKAIALSAAVAATVALTFNRFLPNNNSAHTSSTATSSSDNSSTTTTTTSKLVSNTTIVPRPPTRQRKNSSSLHTCSSERVQKFVLTGGPCGGKTTALARIRTFLGERGFRVFFVPEAATFLFGNGTAPQDNKCANDWVDFQRLLMQMQMRFEDCMVERAEKACEGDANMRAIIICDRGTMDGKAYVDAKGWKKVLSVQHLDEVTIRDARYNAVLHMTTAADGAEGFYTSENNPSRMEGVEEARVLDAKIREAWLGHPQQIVFR